MMTACVNGFVGECLASTSALKLTFVGPIRRQFLSAAEAETAPSVLWFAAIQGIECNQDLADLAPKSCFVAAETIEREVW